MNTFLLSFNIRVALILVFSFFQISNIFSQNTLSGIVVDKANNPINGASIVVKQLNKGSVSGANGNFKITDLASKTYTVIVSFIGYETLKEEVSVLKNSTQTFTLLTNSILAKEVVVTSTRVSKKTPISYSEINKKEIEDRNLGQDLPILMSYMPSVVTTSDAGAGVGYTGIRVRGSDAQRVNVTVNGIPLNDSESSGVFWVNMPDFASSVEDIQLQRGVGTSTNGSASFGASLNIKTNDVVLKPSAEVNVSSGSFNTNKIMGMFSTGKFANNWEFNGRISKINSDGYIDRAKSDLSSYYFSGSFSSGNTFIKALSFGGKEVTYQSWNGASAYDIETYGRTFNSAGAKYDESWNVIGYYDNEVDNYKQDHNQLHITQVFSNNVSANISLHYTKGQGYYEQYKQGAEFKKYGMQNVVIGNETIETTNLIRRKWLDNDFYGAIANFQYNTQNLNVVVGGGANKYIGDHFGNVIWAQYASNSEIKHEYYNNTGTKIDANLFAKATYSFNNGLNVFADVQGRFINYKMTDKADWYKMNDEFNFFNPKAGLSYEFNNQNIIFASYSIAHKEPNRTDYESAIDNSTAMPKEEKLQDVEVGYRLNSDKISFNTNFYYMYYTNQLVLTGELDDVGNTIRKNSGKSYRSGIELDLNYTPVSWFAWRPNFTFSQNKNIGFNTTENDKIENLGDTKISYSPEIVATNMFVVKPVKGLYLNVISKYVGKQFMTNTEAEESELDAYFVTDFNATYKVPKFSETVNLEANLLLNNVLNAEYASNGYMWGKTAYYYPQAGFNFLVGLKLKIM